MCRPGRGTRRSCEWKRGSEKFGVALELLVEAAPTVCDRCGCRRWAMEGFLCATAVRAAEANVRSSSGSEPRAKLLLLARDGSLVPVSARAAQLCGTLQGRSRALRKMITPRFQSRRAPQPLPWSSMHASA